MSIYNKEPNELIEKAAQELKSVVKAPDWHIFVKTGVSKERPPESKDWWYVRAASILRKVYINGPIGTSKLSKKYGSKKNMGHKPGRFYNGSRKIIRTILQQLEEQQLIKQEQKGVHKGRLITPKGKSFLDKIK
jgi:small subunit ribosomal protein S19e